MTKSKLLDNILLTVQLDYCSPPKFSECLFSNIVRGRRLAIAKQDSKYFVFYYYSHTQSDFREPVTPDLIRKADEESIEIIGIARNLDEAIKIFVKEAEKVFKDVPRPEYIKHLIENLVLQPS